MNPFILTLSLLMLMTIVTTSEVSRFISESRDALHYQDFIETEAFIQEQLMEARFFDLRKAPIPKEEKTEEKLTINEVKPKTRPKQSRKSVSLEINEARPPNNSRLNFFPLIFRQDERVYEWMAGLMRKLYGNSPLFQSYPRIEYRILEALQEKQADASFFAYPDDLASLIFGDPDVQAVFCWMLQENESVSLLNFINFDRNSGVKLNFMFAPKELLEIYLENSSVVDTILAEREKLWERILYEEANRKELAKEECIGRKELKQHLIDFFVQTVSAAGLSPELYKLFDFSLGHQGNILIYVDAETGQRVREKVPS